MNSAVRLTSHSFQHGSSAVSSFRLIGLPTAMMRMFQTSHTHPCERGILEFVVLSQDYAARRVLPQEGDLRAFAKRNGPIVRRFLSRVQALLLVAIASHQIEGLKAIERMDLHAGRVRVLAHSSFCARRPRLRSLDHGTHALGIERTLRDRMTMRRRE